MSATAFRSLDRRDAVDLLAKRPLSYVHGMVDQGLCTAGRGEPDMAPAARRAAAGRGTRALMRLG